MERQFNPASALVLALLASAPILAAYGQAPMPPMGGKSAATGMNTMDKMTSGLSATDKKEMTAMMGKMAAMPPADRKKAMQKMSGTGTKPDSGRQADPNASPMPPSGGMGGDM